MTNDTNSLGFLDKKTPGIPLERMPGVRPGDFHAGALVPRAIGGGHYTTTVWGIVPDALRDVERRTCAAAQVLKR